MKIDWFACCLKFQILKCISQLELAQLIGTGVKTRYITGPSSQTTTSNSIEAFDPEGSLGFYCHPYLPLHYRHN